MSDALLWSFGPVAVEMPVDYVAKMAPVAACPGARFCAVVRGGEPYWWGAFDADEVQESARVVVGLWLLIPRALT